VLFSFSCAEKEFDVEAALGVISAKTLAKNVSILSADDFEGRFPASAGEEKTVNFLETEFEKLGLEPGNGDSFFQEVPLVAITADPKTRLEVTGGEESMMFTYAEDFVAGTLRVQEQVSLSESEMIFIGYGIVAPEYGWDDYAGLDVKGKTVVMLVNDPGYATQDPELFTGMAMTYFGRWTYKFEEAARQGAEGAIIIHETEPASYGWAVVRNGWTGPQYSLVRDDNNLSRCAVESWITLDTAKKVIASAGLNFEEMKTASVQPGFEPISLGLRASIVVKNSITYSSSRNVIALLRGSKRADEYIIYTAHWDHLGMNPGLEGDQIYNGALDNATGTAALIELARAFKRVNPAPERSLVFLAVTAEEQGLIGSDYYARHPVFPLNRTVAAINMDSLNIWGKMRDVRIVGYGRSELDDYVRSAAEEQGRVVLPDLAPERGSYYRSDHFSFAKQGLPSLYVTTGVQHIENGEEWGRSRKIEHNRQHYHRPSDEYDPNWDLTGAVQDLQLLFKVAYRLSMETAFPEWSEDSEFKRN
jgi:Zn-dependent M28 family amino/carboxypeptidase